MVYGAGVASRGSPAVDPINPEHSQVIERVRALRLAVSSKIHARRALEAAPGEPQNLRNGMPQIRKFYGIISITSPATRIDHLATGLASPRTG